MTDKFTKGQEVHYAVTERACWKHYETTWHRGVIANTWIDRYTKETIWCIAVGDGTYKTVPERDVRSLDHPPGGWINYDA